MGFGLRAPNSQGRGFADQVEAIVREHNWLAPLIEPLVLVWRCALKQVAAMNRRLPAIARAHPDCRRLMTVPGVGVIVALALAAAADDPARFAALSSVGAYLGLTPRRYQSGQVDRTGLISKCGDRQLRTTLRGCPGRPVPRAEMVRAQGVNGGEHARPQLQRVRRGAVAIARKLAVLMHAMLVKQTDFHWSKQREQTAA
jgi:transposase